MPWIGIQIGILQIQSSMHGQQSHIIHAQMSVAKGLADLLVQVSHTLIATFYFLMAPAARRRAARVVF